MWVKRHRREKSAVLGVCSDELLGKTLTDEKLQLEISPDFFGGEKRPLSELKDFVDEFNNMMLVGNDVVDEAVKLGVVLEENVKTLKGVKWVICLGE